MEGCGPKRRHSGRFGPDPLIAARAFAQHGVVTLRQLEALALSPSAVRSRVAAGRLHRVHAGVYSVGHARLTREGRYMAAVLACGHGALLSYRSCGALLGLRASSRAVIDVTSPTRAGRKRAGIEVHACATASDDAIQRNAIPCTSVARTLLDLAAVINRRELERACDRAEMLQVFDLRALQDVLTRANGHRGAGPLRAVLAGHSIGADVTRSELEERFLALCESAALPRPQCNAWLALGPDGVEADFVWRRQRLVVETDGRIVHSTRQAFERDRRRDQRLMLAGWRVVRFTWREVVGEPGVVAETVRALLTS